MRISIILASLAWSSAAAAGDISRTGAVIEVEAYRCQVTSPRTIECKNIGRVCEQALAAEKKESDYYLGCALNEWKEKHPREKCPESNGWHYAGAECNNLLLGW